MDTFFNSPIIGSMDQGSVLTEDAASATIYLAVNNDREVPVLLLFEEDIVKSSGWKRASQSGRRVWQKMKDRYEQIVSEVFADDRFLTRLKNFRKITVLLNQPIEPAVVKERLHRILRDRSYHHLRWMIIDLVLLPLALFPMFLPGPNLIGYYLVFRIYSHWRSYRSARDTHLQQVDVIVTNKAEEVNALIRKAQTIRTALHELRQKYGLRALQESQFVPQSVMFRELWNHWTKERKEKSEE
jgi:hypothetical protein